MTTSMRPRAPSGNRGPRRSTGSDSFHSLLSPRNSSPRINQEDRDVPLIEQLGGSEARGLYQDQFLAALERVGISPNSPKFAPTRELLADLPDNLRTSDIVNLKTHDVFLSRALDGDLVIKDFAKFSQILSDTFREVEKTDGGAVASYIPQLARANPEQFGVGVCSTDGQQWKMGDADKYFCIQSISKTITYILALEEHGEEKVHSHVGREPSGVGFNERLLNSDGLPHNPYINSGAIMCASLVQPKQDLSARFDHVMDIWSRITGGRPTFANSTYLGERSTADRNFCLAYMMNEAGAFPEGTDLMATLDFYFMLCSIEVTADMLAVAAGTLASGGVCPATGERVFQEQNVRDCLSLMASCGLYDGSGEFFFDIGFPAKSGVAGGIMIVIPGVVGMCTFSPRLEGHGNSFRGIRFCEQLVVRLDYHQFSIHDSETVSATYEKVLGNVGPELLFAVHRNDLSKVRIFVGSRPDVVHFADYDKRTALHIAASNGHMEIIKFLVAHGAKKDVKDTTDSTPLDDAKRGKHKDAIKFLSSEHKYKVTYGGKTEEEDEKNDEALFAALDDDASGVILKNVIIKLLEISGIVRSDNWKDLYSLLDNFEPELSVETFVRLTRRFPIVRQCVTSNLAIPEWKEFTTSLKRFYDETATNSSGTLSDNVPKVAQVDENLWEMSFCSTNGQMYNQSNSSKGVALWSVRSIVHIVNYLIAQELLGEEEVHKHVGKEPSGRNFNELSLNPKGRPHNPTLTAGALTVLSLIKPGESKRERFKYIVSQWKRLTLGEDIGYHKESYQFESAAVTRKWTLAYMLLETGTFPEHVKTHEDIKTTLELYFMTMSLQVRTDQIARIGAVLANGGVDPFTRERIFNKKHVRNVLSIMYACGMYDYSGEFTFRVGIPAQSGEGGGVLAVVPELGGFCTFSPRLDKSFNSVRGLKFYCQLTQEYSFHAYETMVRYKKDPTVFGGNWNDPMVYDLLDAGSRGDLVQIKKVLAYVDINSKDYDNRTVLHCATENNCKRVVYFLLDQGADRTIKDRWGRTPVECTESRKLRELLAPAGLENAPPPSIRRKVFSRGLMRLGRAKKRSTSTK